MITTAIHSQNASQLDEAKEAKRHQARQEVAARIGAKPVRAARISLIAAIRGLQEAGCQAEASMLLEPTFAILARWAYMLAQGKRETDSKADVPRLLGWLRSAKAIDAETYQLGVEVFSQGNLGGRAPQRLMELLRRLDSLTANVVAEWIPTKEPRDFRPACRLYSAKCYQPGRKTLLAQAQVYDGDRGMATLGDCLSWDALAQDPELAEEVARQRRIAKSVVTAKPERTVPTLEDADRLLSDGTPIIAGMVAYAALMDRLRDWCFAHKCRPAHESRTWERGYRPSQYADSLHEAGIFSEEDSATVRRLEVVGLNIATFVIQDQGMIQAFVEDVRGFFEMHAHPSCATAAGRPAQRIGLKGGAQ